MSALPDDTLMAKLRAGLGEAPEAELLAAADTLTRLDGPVLPVAGCARDALNQTLHTTTAGPVVYTIALPAGLRLLNSNEIRKMHWATERGIARDIVDAAIVMTRKAKVPKLERVVISSVLHPKDRRTLDPHNWSPSVKAATDGIVRSGVLADDDSEHVTDGGIVLGEPVKGGQLVLLITVVDGAR